MTEPLVHTRMNHARAMRTCRTSSCSSARPCRAIAARVLATDPVIHEGEVPLDILDVATRQLAEERPVASLHADHVHGAMTTCVLDGRLTSVTEPPHRCESSP